MATYVSKYLNFLRDPVDLGPLRLQGDYLNGETSGLRYGFVGNIADLRPDSGMTEIIPEAIHNRVRDHYDETPCNNYMELDNLPLGRWLREPKYDYLFEGANTVIEVGCGKGAIVQAFKEHRGIAPFCIDLAYGSIRQIQNAPLNADGVLGSNLKLPIADAVADLVISHGVTHHTPDPLRCFMELVRILKPGGKLFYAVYNWDNLYRSLYFSLSPPLKGIQYLFGKKTGDKILKWTVFPPYHLMLWMTLGFVQGKWKFPAIEQSWEQFGDFFLTPIARFYHANELQTLADLFGLKILEQETGGWPRNGFSHFVWYEKTLNAAAEGADAASSSDSTNQKRAG